MTPTNRPKSVLMDGQTTNWDDFVINVHRMSHLRFAMFSVSIVMCFAVAVAVLFVVPCEWSDCAAPTANVELLWSDSVFNDIGSWNVLLFAITIITIIITIRSH